MLSLKYSSKVDEMQINKAIAFTIIFFLGYGIINFIPTFGISLAIPVVTETTEVFWFNLPLSTFLDLVISPPFTIIVFYLIQKAIKQDPIANDPNPSQLKRKIIKFLLYSAGVVLVVGITMHAVANVLNGMLGDPVPPSSNLEIAIYWFDEVLGHKVIHCAISAFWVGCIVLQYWHRKEMKVPLYQLAGRYFWAIAIGAVIALAAAEGQAAFDLMIINIVFIAILLFLFLSKKLKLRENPLSYFLLIYFCSMVITVIIYGFISGWLPGYPFLLQPPFT